MENFRKFCPKSRFFDKFDEISDFSPLFTKIDIFNNLDQNRDFLNFLTEICKVWPNFLGELDQNQDLGKILSQIDFTDDIG